MAIYLYLGAADFKANGTSAPSRACDENADLRRRSRLEPPHVVRRAPSVYLPNVS